MSGCTAGIQRLEQTSCLVPPGSGGKAGCWAPPLSPPWGAGDWPGTGPCRSHWQRPVSPGAGEGWLCFVPPGLGHGLRCFVGDSPPSAVSTLVLSGLSHPGAGGFRAAPASQCSPAPGDGGILAVTPHEHSLLPRRWRGPFPPGGACRLKMEPLPCCCSPARSPRGPDSILSCGQGVQSGSVSGEHAGSQAQPPRGRAGGSVLRLAMCLGSLPCCALGSGASVPRAPEGGGGCEQGQSTGRVAAGTLRQGGWVPTCPPRPSVGVCLLPLLLKRGWVLQMPSAGERRCKRHTDCQR